MAAGTSNIIPVWNFEVARGAPKAISFRSRTVNETGPLRSFDSTVTMEIEAGLQNKIIILTVGNGITLSNAIDEKNGNAVTTNGLLSFKLTESQSRDLSEDNQNGYEIQEGSTGNETLILMGRLIGKGGRNSGA